MKKLLVAGLLLIGFGVVARADITSDIGAALLDRVSTVTQIDARGTTRLALMDSVVRFGHYNGMTIVHLQAGFTGDTKPESGEVKSANFAAGVQVRFDPFLKDLGVIPDSWLFLRSIEHGPAYHYDLRTRSGYASYQFGLAFGLSPKL